MITRKRNLHTGRSIWHEKRAFPVPQARLRRDLVTDVVIVGAGISGALIAEMLASDGHAVTILDRRGPASGSTAASTALVQYEIDTPLSLLARKIGTADAIRAWRRSFQAVANLAARTQELGLEAEIARRATLYLSGSLLAPEALRAEGELRRAAGIETFHLKPSALAERFGIARRSGLLGHGSLALDPRRLATGYLRAAIRKGARLYAPCEVSGIAFAARSVTIATKLGPAIRAKTAVFATGYEFPDFVPLTGHQIVSTYALATRPQPRELWPECCFIWEAAEPYLYLRTTRDGRVIAGGEDADIADAEARDALLDAKVRRIGRKFTRLFPGLDVQPAFAWAGSFGESSDGLPSIGPVPGHPNCWAVLGYGGNGITYGRIAAEVIRTALSGREDPDADLYAFRGD